MSNPKREQLALEEQVKEIARADRRFFNRFPERSFRFRLAAEAEIELCRRAGMPGPTTLQGNRYFLAIFNETPKRIRREFVSAPPDMETDLSEDQAREIYMEARLRTVLVKAIRWLS